MRSIVDRDRILSLIRWTRKKLQTPVSQLLGFKDDRKDYKRVVSAASRAELEGRDINEAVMAAAHG